MNMATIAVERDSMKTSQPMKTKNIFYYYKIDIFRKLFPKRLYPRLSIVHQTPII
jgi:hypothetical protein